MNLYVEPLKASALGQALTVGTQSQNLSSLRLHLLKYGNPAGSVIVSINGKSADGSYYPIQTSSSVLISTFSASNYWHGYAQFSFTLGLRASTEYWILLSSSGYTFGTSDYVGWVADLELRKYPNASYGNALDMEVWTRKSIQRGIY